MTSPIATKEVIVIGAGPYGLSTAAYLRKAGVDPYVIGHPMGFWKQNMPGGMLLRSGIEATNISAPEPQLSLAGYQRATARRLTDPLPVEDFVAYGDWFQAQVAPTVDRRVVQTVSQVGSRFQIRLDDGETLEARSVVLALGIGPFLHRPEPFLAISRHLAPHSSEVHDPRQFTGKRVAVIGKGQSALEYAALLQENNVDVQIITRGPTLAFRSFPWRKHLFRRLTPGPLKPLSHRILPPTDLGGLRTARKMADPEKFRRQAPEMQEALLRDCARPVGAYWLPQRLNGVRVKTGVTVEGVDIVGDGLKLTFSDGSSGLTDRVLLGTGYKIDLSKLQVLDRALRDQIVTAGDGYPILTSGMQTSVRGLYMVGVVAEKILGPTLRFVTGTSNAAPRLAAAITGHNFLR